MARVPLFKTNQGLWVDGGKESGPSATLRRCKGIHPLSRSTLRSRDGGTVTSALTGHSLTRFDNKRFIGAGTQFYKDGASIKTGLDGNRLAFVKMPPQPGIADYLFVAGGGSLFKVASDGTVTNWGIVAPVDGFVASKSSGTNSKSLEVFDSVTGWTTVNCSVAVDGTVKQEGTNSIKMTVNKSLVASITKTSALDLIDLPSGNQDFGLDSYVRLWFRIDNVAALDHIQVQFDVNGGAFNSDVYSATIIAEERDLPRLPPRMGAQEILQELRGVSTGRRQTSFGGRSGQPLILSEEDTIAILEDAFRSEQMRRNMADLVATKRFQLEDETWQEFKMPKRIFSRSGESSNDWSDVEAIRIIVRTTGVDTVNVHFDDLRVYGLEPMRGNYKFKITYTNTITGSRSNANPTAQEVDGFDLERASFASLPSPIFTAATPENRSVSALSVSWRRVSFPLSISNLCSTAKIWRFDARSLASMLFV